MKLGILADIHEHVENLRAALARLREERVDRIVFLGDVFETGQRIEASCALLAEAEAAGVWGNHDFGLCFHPSTRTRRTYSPTVIDFMRSLYARLELGDCLFSHIEPWLDPMKVEDLWYYDGLPTTEKLPRVFGATRARIIFVGHFHRWRWATETELTGWSGAIPIDLSTGRHYVVVNALCFGHFATFDTATNVLTPFMVER